MDERGHQHDVRIIADQRQFVTAGRSELGLRDDQQRLAGRRELLRRCLHLFIPFPDAALEQRIIRARVPEADARLRTQLVAFVQGLRAIELKKKPAISETIDWARTLVLLHARELEPGLVRDTLSVLLKFQDDIDNVAGELRGLVEKARAA